MNKKALITVVIGTILLFIWNAISWMGLPFHSNSLKNIPEDAIQTSLIKEKIPSSGVYHFPGLPADNSPEAISEIEAKLAKGPRITMMVYKNNPTKLFDPKTFLFSAIINLITVIFTFVIISKIRLKNTKNIILTSLSIGLVASFVSDVSLMNWYMFPLDYTLINAVDKVVSFGLLGLLFAFYTFKNQEYA